MVSDHLIFKDPSLLQSHPAMLVHILSAVVQQASHPPQCSLVFSSCGSAECSSQTAPLRSAWVAGKCERSVYLSSEPRFWGEQDMKISKKILESIASEIKDTWSGWAEAYILSFGPLTFNTFVTKFSSVKWELWWYSTCRFDLMLKWVKANKAAKNSDQPF